MACPNFKKAWKMASRTLGDKILLCLRAHQIFIHTFFNICKVITFKVEENVFFPSTQGVLQAKKNHFLEKIWIEGLQILILK
jgi:hypothetical protein